jgi:meso-butanediol dehydrogenase/(S,S)-butanediol dehydrogenase/diacetyl reductase
MSEGLEGKIALVTGAGRGIGLATAKRLRGLGALVVAGLEEESQREAVRDFDPVVLNVLHEEHWAAAVGHCKDAHGGIDVLVNNAGILREGTRGVFLGCKHVIPLMRERGGGAIVNLASIDGLHGNHRHVAYAASKGGVVSITRALAMDHAPENIRVNSVCPGTVRTQMVMENMAGYNEQTVKEKHPLGREAEPEEVANVIAFLCGPGASFMTGMAVPVDGGRSIR